MSERPKPPQQDPQTTDGLKEWETPELIVEDVQSVTKGGTFTCNSPGDDAWYQS
jgi:hypothetical protein